MKHSLTFSTPPWLEWHGMRPFAMARLDPAYARTLEEVALRLEDRIQNLPVTEGWENAADENPTGSRYGHYNAFMLAPAMLPLFLALRTLHRFLLDATGVERQPSVLQSWFNVHRVGQRLLRHQHAAQYIGYFVAHGEGSVTRFGAWPITHESDHPLQNQDGLLVVTLGRNHFHEVSQWTDAERARVSFAFDIINVNGDNGSPAAPSERASRVLIPFDGPDFAA